MPDAERPGPAGLSPRRDGRVGRVSLMSDPASFLAERFAEDETRLSGLLDFIESLPHVAPTSQETPLSVVWTAATTDEGFFLHLRPGGLEVWFREDPRRLEHDLRARSQIAADHHATSEGWCATCAEALADRAQPVAYPCPTLRRLTWMYAEHPDFDETWAEL